MKKIIYIASFLCTALLAGCDDFLTTESPDFSTDKYWRDKADVEAGSICRLRPAGLPHRRLRGCRGKVCCRNLPERRND